MTVKELQKMAKVLGVKTVGLRKGELIKQIQKAEGNFDCFGSATDYCDQMNCLFHLPQIYPPENRSKNPR